MTNLNENTEKKYFYQKIRKKSQHFMQNFHQIFHKQKCYLIEMKQNREIGKLLNIYVF